jgi:chromosome segregation ATPase
MIMSLYFKPEGKMCDDVTWPTFNSCSFRDQERVGRTELWYSNLFGARISRSSHFRTFTIAAAFSLSALFSIAGPVATADADTLIPRAKLAAAEQSVKALQMELAEVKKDRAALQQQLEMASGEVAKQIEQAFTSTSWKSDPEVMVLRGKLDAAGKEIEKYAATSRDSTAEVAALKIKLKAAGSQIDTLNKEKDGALSKVSRLKNDLAASVGETKRLEAERAKLAKSEEARKAVEKMLAVALTTNKAKDEELLEAAKRYRTELQSADNNIADLETRLAKADALHDKMEEAQNALRQSEQMVKNLKTKLGNSSKERDVLKDRLDETQNEISQRIEKVSAAASQNSKRSKQQIKQLDAQINSVKNQKNELKQNLERAQMQATHLDRELNESAAERDNLKKQVQASLAKVDAALKERIQVEQAAAKEAEALRNQLASAMQQISRAEAEAKSTPNEVAKRIEKMISVAAAQTSTEVSDLKDQLDKANNEIARLKAAQVKISASSTTQQPALPSGATLESKQKKIMQYLSGEKDLKPIKN